LSFVITANLLSSGDAVYRNEAGAWSPDIAAAALYATTEDASAALVAARADAVTLEVELIEVTVEAGGPTPLRLREKIRAFGPTVRSDHRPPARRPEAADVPLR
jgi:sulfite reductase (NADPH) hemoprotein beta-component